MDKYERFACEFVFTEYTGVTFKDVIDSCLSDKASDELTISERFEDIHYSDIPDLLEELIEAAKHYFK